MKSRHGAGSRPQNPSGEEFSIGVHADGRQGPIETQTGEQARACLQRLGLIGACGIRGCRALTRHMSKLYIAFVLDSGVLRHLRTTRGKFAAGNLPAVGHED